MKNDEFDDNNFQSKIDDHVIFYCHIKVDSFEKSQVFTIDQLEKRVSALEKVIGILHNKKSRTSITNSKNPHLTQFEDWLVNTMYLGQYYDIFVDNGFDAMISVCELKDRDLINMGINKKGHRIKILKGIVEYNKLNQLNPLK